MNEWVIAGIVIVGTLVAGGGGAWISSLFRKKPAPPKA
jgi:hypothetical protein